MNLKNVTADLKEGTRLVAISKYHPAESIQEAYDAGQRIFGESHVQELMAKIAPFISLIHAVDTPKLLRELNKQGEKNERVLHCLLELHIATEETKYGFSPEELTAYLETDEWTTLKYVSIDGLMCMATNTEDEEQIRSEFRRAKSIYDDVRARFFATQPSFCELSMGMSHDYPIAMEEGSTLIRVGSKIFGERVYDAKENS